MSSFYMDDDDVDNHLKSSSSSTASMTSLRHNDHHHRQQQQQTSIKMSPLSYSNIDVDNDFEVDMVNVDDHHHEDHHDHHHLDHRHDHQRSPLVDNRHSKHSNSIDHLLLNHHHHPHHHHDHHIADSDHQRPDEDQSIHDSNDNLNHDTVTTRDDNTYNHLNNHNEIELVFKNISHSIKLNNVKKKKSVKIVAADSNAVAADLKNYRQILENIDGYATSGQILAVMGPSGCGKTTFLNIVSGRTKPSISGDIYMNGQSLNKQLRRRICYVLQQDIFFPNLTLKQTLMYTARLRLPESMTNDEKSSLIDKILDELQLSNCKNTIIGDIGRRGLSGGEKKRANIACELLTNPSVLILDEPTSGLDSCTAHKLLQILKNYSLKRKKTIIMSIHQPSSKMFYMLDNLLLLTSNGRLAYFGSIHNVVPFFNNLNYCINIHYNPAEFVLEIIKDDSPNDDVNQSKIVAAAKQLIKIPKLIRTNHLSNVFDVHTHHDHDHDEMDHVHDREEQLHQSDSHQASQHQDTDHHSSDYHHQPHDHHQPPHDHHHHHHHHHHQHKFNGNDNDSGRSSWSDRSSTFSSNSFIRDDCCDNHNHSNHSNHNRKHNHHHHHHQQNNDHHHDHSKTDPLSSELLINDNDFPNNHCNIIIHQNNNSKFGSNNSVKWPTSLWTQIAVLTERNFHEAKHRMLSKLNWIQTIGLALIVGLLWFQIERNEDTMNDVRGWMFFTTTYWMQFGLFQALMSFPSERQVINKERSSGSYRLSAYYIAKMIGELPLTLTLPTVFFFISYPLLGWTSIRTSLSLWFYLIISIIGAQSFGLFMGSLCDDLEVSITISALYSLSTMLFAGYYSSIPQWLSWTRYFSLIYYAFQNMQLIEFGYENLLCSKSLSKFEYCQRHQHHTGPTFIPYQELELNLDLMNPNSAPLPIWFNTLILLLFLLIFRLMGYIVLRYTKKPTIC